MTKMVNSGGKMQNRITARSKNCGVERIHSIRQADADVRNGMTRDKKMTLWVKS